MLGNGFSKSYSTNYPVSYSDVRERYTFKIFMVTLWCLVAVKALYSKEFVPHMRVDKSSALDIQFLQNLVNGLFTRLHIVLGTRIVAKLHIRPSVMFPLSNLVRLVY